MSQKNAFVPHHINATADDLAGNAGIGRYIFLPGSNGRAKEIATHFNQLTIKTHPRGHDLYLGSIQESGKVIDVAAVASGMGCPSMEIILHELFHLGAKRFLRVGTAGSLQPTQVNTGDLVNAMAAVRDEQTTSDYVPINIPAVASLEFVDAISAADKKLKLPIKLHTGTVHTKSSFYAREFGSGPSTVTNKAYLKLLTQAGILASEMEASALFIQSQLYNYQLMQKGNGSRYRVLCGALLGITGVSSDLLNAIDKEKMMINYMLRLALETIKGLALMECKDTKC